MKLGVYDTEGPEGEARGGTSEGKEQDRGERAKRASEGGKSKAEEPPKRGGGKLQVYMLEHARHFTRIVNSCGQCTLRVRATQKYLAPGLTKVPRDKAI